MSNLFNISNAAADDDDADVPQFVVAVVLCIAGVVAEGYGTNINKYGNAGRITGREAFKHNNFLQGKQGATNALRDFGRFDGQALNDYRSGNKNVAQANDFGSKQGKANQQANTAAQAFQQQEGRFSQIANQIASAAKRRGYHSDSVGRYDKKDDNRAQGYNAAAANKKAYNRGKVFNDKIDYAFNKKFDQNLSERGGFEEENGHNAHKLDEYRDKQKARKVLRGDHTAANSRNDAQRALKESNYRQNAAQKHVQAGSYGKSDKNLDKAGATQDAQSVQFDRKDSKYASEDKGKQQAISKKNHFANKDAVAARQAAASHAGDQLHADKKYYGGHGDPNSQNSGTVGYGNNGGHGGAGTGGGAGAGRRGSGSHGEGSGGLSNHKYGENAQQLDNSKVHAAEKAGAVNARLQDYLKSRNKIDFAQIKSLRDHRNGKFAQGVHSAENKGFNSKQGQAAKTASGGDKKLADAAAHSQAKAAKHDFDEAAFDKENFRKRLQDSNENFRKRKQFYHDKKSGGNNVEKLLYNRKRVENEFGQTQAAEKQHQNQFQKAHASLKHNQASRKDGFDDVKKTSNGYQVNNQNKQAAGKSHKAAANAAKAQSYGAGHKKAISQQNFGQGQHHVQRKEQDLRDKALGSNFQRVLGQNHALARQQQHTGNGGGSLGGIGGNNLFSSLGGGNGGLHSGASRGVNGGIGVGVGVGIGGGSALHGSGGNHGGGRQGGYGNRNRGSSFQRGRGSYGTGPNRFAGRGSGLGGRTSGSSYTNGINSIGQRTYGNNGNGRSSFGGQRPFGFGSSFGFLGNGGSNGGGNGGGYGNQRGGNHRSGGYPTSFGSSSLLSSFRTPSFRFGTPQNGFRTNAQFGRLY
ncbi:LOW QUALITY PROTEIN: keratin, type I cytoskeletal 9-like [Gigantopelta aegis]|uniref:LOW QUALITY PROTEIN: keratin, type I cytoskeletal 9-like n=1 Tax=Gigantopelta aegis TaxID=1735272 RepID=UPI001B888034|nr:LOW QUALITY PROTEIN: keratin, type I cytoskeletal 9-like [Gigantopelta aegis]